MKGRSANIAERAFWDALCDLGCIACRKDGRRNSRVSVHHVDGRTKPWAHWLVLPLCAGHHQDGTGPRGLIAVHPFQARFELKYGKQRDLLIECLHWLEDQGYVVPDKAWEAANGTWERMAA